MFGKNEVTSPFQKEDGSLLVNELWHTIQGEGPDAGTPAFFLRLAKCNLRCFFCDTEFETGTPYSLEEISERLGTIAGQHPGTRLLVITGGEPFLQNFLPLTKFANSIGLRVSIETAGTIFLPGLQSYFSFGHWEDDNKIICSPKTPKLNPHLVPYIEAYKYIIRYGETAEDDGLPDCSTQIAGDKDRLFRPQKMDVDKIFVQPCDENDQSRDVLNMLATREISLRYGYRISLQLHKLLGVP